MSYTIKVDGAEFTAPTMGEALEMARKWDAERLREIPLDNKRLPWPETPIWPSPRDMHPSPCGPYSPPGPPPWIVWCNTQ